MDRDENGSLLEFSGNLMGNFIIQCAIDNVNWFDFHYLRLKKDNHDFLVLSSLLNFEQHLNLIIMQYFSFSAFNDNFDEFLQSYSGVRS